MGTQNKLHFAPLEEIKGGMHTALDIGTGQYSLSLSTAQVPKSSLGTGIWAMEFGRFTFAFVFSFGDVHITYMLLSLKPVSAMMEPIPVNEWANSRNL